MNTEELNQLIIDTLDENKAIDVQSLDVTSLTDVTDRLIICSGTSSRHVKALADKVIERAKIMNIPPLGVEGEETSEWILVDLNDIIVHIMLPDIRKFYDLERLWAVSETLVAKR